MYFCFLFSKIEDISPKKYNSAENKTWSSLWCLLLAKCLTRGKNNLQWTLVEVETMVKPKLTLIPNNLENRSFTKLIFSKLALRKLVIWQIGFQQKSCLLIGFLWIILCKLACFLFNVMFEITGHLFSL